MDYSQLDISMMLKKEREKRLMTFNDIGNALGCSASYVFRIEKGKRKQPSYEIVLKMINFFNLRDEDLNKYISGDVPPKIHKVANAKKDIIHYAERMDINNSSEINLLLNKVKIYQEVSR